jgi:hypothetical protein
MSRRVAVWGVVVAAALALTWCLQGVITDLLVGPLAYLAWRANLFLRSTPQWVYWSLVVTGVALVALVSLVRTLHLGRRATKGHPPVPGPVGKMARQIRAARRGVYTKWLVACRLGGLARAMLAQRERGAGEAAPPDQLQGRDWHPPTEVQAYLEAGLGRPSISGRRPGAFFRSPPTPLDMDLNQVVDYLESQMEMRE